MFDQASNDMVALVTLCMSDSEKGIVVRFSSSAGKNDLLWVAIQERRNSVS